MSALLWTLVALGGWNAANLLARLWYGEGTQRYVWSIVAGAWAAALLWRGGCV